jgi:exopolyphosphatase / guanosine-5'-triphosphate,3'-diphosphate pyrophosphatase
MSRGPVAAIDIGTNSTRLLVTWDDGDVVRESVVTGLGRGLSETGVLSSDAIGRTCRVLETYRQVAESCGVERMRAVTTAAARSAGNTDEFLEAATTALGVSPEVVSGEVEAALSYAGAVSDLEGDDWTVVDIGGGSTEVISGDGGVSYPIGSVVMSDLHLIDAPTPPEQVASARRAAMETLAPVAPAGGGVAGVAGTWTSLAAMDLASAQVDGSVRVHHVVLSRQSIERWIERLAAMSGSERERIPGLDPARAPVILGGAVVASVVVDRLGCDEVVVSERDLLDGLALEMLREMT